MQRQPTGTDLRERREREGLSQRQLARACGLHHRTVQYWEVKSVLDHWSPAVRAMVAALDWRILPPRHARAAWGIREKQEAEPIEQLFRSLPKSLPNRLANPRTRCNAMTRAGMPCRAKSEPGRKRCRFHGGLSTGPKTKEGRARIAEAQRKRWAVQRRDCEPYAENLTCTFPGLHSRTNPRARKP